MHKTTVYLGDEEVEQLRRLAHESGTSQAELIRKGIQAVLADRPQRRFRSMGVARADANGAKWDTEHLYDRVIGKA